ncbi:SchA/CurD-like domain-containing protein [Saccharomonospora azurea]|uniref:SchA/CurD-like domain-containing protein n=1 Tax=Saccharomonospora azurea TaxID=40988 RepID=UPI002408F70F|nr:SchA/CurD-like domain-containing protein [Saccharomonospora azurea]
MERHALTFPVRPGSADAVRRVLSEYPRPQTHIGNGCRLLATSVFLWENHVVRVIDVEGPLPVVMRHLANDPAIRETEEKLNPLLVRPRDFSDPESVGWFFRRAMMTRVVHQEASPTPRMPRGKRTRVALRYPVRPGRGEAAARIFAWGQSLPLGAALRTGLAGTTVFRHGDFVVRVLDVEGDADEAIERLGPTVIGGPTAAALTELLEPGCNLATAAGRAKFLAEARLTLVTHREADGTARGTDLGADFPSSS